MPTAPWDFYTIIHSKYTCILVSCVCLEHNSNVGEQGLIKCPVYLWMSLHIITFSTLQTKLSSTNGFPTACTQLLLSLLHLHPLLGISYHYNAFYRRSGLVNNRTGMEKVHDICQRIEFSSLHDVSFDFISSPYWSFQAILVLSYLCKFSAGTLKTWNETRTPWETHIYKFNQDEKSFFVNRKKCC